MAGHKVAILIVNYNMSERADALAEHIYKYVEWPYELILIDNGSDLVPPSKYSVLRLPQNVQTTGGWLAGLEYTDSLGDDFLAYWFLITSAEFVDPKDTLTPMAQLMVNDVNVVGVHPALTEDSTTAWKHLITQNNGQQPRKTWMIDNIASLWRADWFNTHDRFDPALIYGWGIDLETCWKARKEYYDIYVHEGVRVKKVTDIGYAMERMNMSAEERVRLAGQNMSEVLSSRYGPNWWTKMMSDYVNH